MAENIGYCSFAYCSEVGYATGINVLGARSQVNMRVLSSPFLPAQVFLKKKAIFNAQVRLRITPSKALPVQVRQRVNSLAVLPLQVRQRINTIATLPSQVLLRINAAETLFSQVLQRINTQTPLNAQALLRINTLKALNSQVNLSSAAKLLTQVNLFLYNNTQLRILLKFDSRGTPALGGQNWTSLQAIAPGDFSPNNLNNDIVEYRTQTDQITTLWQLQCDSGQSNTFVDTIAILSHNFTSSARVEFQASDDVNFSSIKYTVDLNVTTENIYYCPEKLNNIPARYFRFVIQDPTNPDTDGLKIGTIVFGSALVLEPSEQFINPLTFGLRHYKDTLATEGFTSTSNDRALRKFLNLTFTQLKINGTNYQLLREYILEAKTDLKCLVIPRPTRPEALAVFAKLSQMPEESHNAVDDDNWRIDLTLDWDESL